MQMTKSQVLLDTETWSVVQIKGIWKQFAVLFQKNNNTNFLSNQMQYSLLPDGNSPQFLGFWFSYIADQQKEKG